MHSLSFFFLRVPQKRRFVEIFILFDFFGKNSSLLQ